LTTDRGFLGKDVVDLAAEAVGQRGTVPTDRVATDQWRVPVDRRGVGLVLAGVDPGQAGVEHRDVGVVQRLAGGEGLGLGARSVRVGERCDGDGAAAVRSVDRLPGRRGRRAAGQPVEVPLPLGGLPNGSGHVLDLVAVLPPGREHRALRGRSTFDEFDELIRR
jgi:hypothetical protein